MPITSVAMGERPEQQVDPACFDNDKLRVRIGDQQFLLNREETSYVNVDPKLNDNHSSLKPEEICQKTSDSSLEVHGFYMRPSLKSCSSELPFSECSLRKISIRLGLAQEPSTISKQQLTDKFQKECGSKKYYKRYCRHYFNYGKYHMTVQYELSAYPEAEIPNTVELLLEKLNAIMGKTPKGEYS